MIRCWTTSRPCLAAIYAGQPVLDLDYAEDSAAGTDGNFVMTGGRQADRGPDVRRRVGLQPGRACCNFWTSPAPGNAALVAAQTGGAGGLRMLKRGDRLLVATHNRGKLEEIADLLGPFGVSVVRAGRPWPARARRDRDHFRRQCPPEGPRRRKGLGS